MPLLHATVLSARASKGAIKSSCSLFVMLLVMLDYLKYFISLYCFLIRRIPNHKLHQTKDMGPSVKKCLGHWVDVFPERKSSVTVEHVLLHTLSAFTFYFPP